MSVSCPEKTVTEIGTVGDVVKLTPTGAISVRLKESGKRKMKLTLNTVGSAVAWWVAQLQRPKTLRVGRVAAP